MSENSNSEQRLNSIKRQARKRRRLRAVIIPAIIIILIAGVIVGGYLFFNFKTYSSFTVLETTELGGTTDNLSYQIYADGYLQCSNSGAVYFDKDGIIWDESFSMVHPLVAICKDYVAIADMKQNDVYLYDKSGLVNHISSGHDIIDVEVAESGLVALATNDGECNYIELKSAEGNDIINVKSVFSSSGYLSDITLSSDGTRLAAAFIYISQGALESKVLFYDFSNSSTDDMLVGGFGQYADTVITDVRFMDNNVVCVVGDNALTFYRFSSEPSIISEELDLEWEIQSVYINNRNLLLVAKDPENEHNYRAYIYNTQGDQVSDIGFDFAFTKAQLAGRNILLYSSTDCQVISFKGLKRFSGTFGSRISYLLPLNSSRYILATSENVRFIRLK